MVVDKNVGNTDVSVSMWPCAAIEFAAENATNVLDGAKVAQGAVSVPLTTGYGFDPKTARSVQILRRIN